MSAEVGQVYLSFKNTSAKAATQVHVIFYVDGLVKGESTLNGTYGPGVEFTTHAFRNSALAPITDPDGLTCKISSVKFEDGSEWKGAESPGVVAKQPDSPVRIDECSVRVSGDAAAKFFILAVLSFENTSSVAIGAVKFNLQFSDAFDTALFHDTYTVSGHFAPGARIDPYVNPISGNFTYDPSSPVWAVYNLRPSEVATVQCSVSAVRFIDGKIWRAP